MAEASDEKFESSLPPMPLASSGEEEQDWAERWFGETGIITRNLGTIAIAGGVLSGKLPTLPRRRPSFPKSEHSSDGAFPWIPRFVHLSSPSALALPHFLILAHLSGLLAVRIGFTMGIKRSAMTQARLWGNPGAASEIEDTMFAGTKEQVASRTAVASRALKYGTVLAVSTFGFGIGLTAWGLNIRSVGFPTPFFSRVPLLFSGLIVLALLSVPSSLHPTLFVWTGRTAGGHPTHGRAPHDRTTACDAQFTACGRAPMHSSFRPHRFIITCVILTNFFRSFCGPLCASRLGSGRSGRPHSRLSQRIRRGCARSQKPCESWTRRSRETCRPGGSG